MARMESATLAIMASTSASDKPLTRADGFSTSNTESNRSRKWSAPAVFPDRNSPASVAVLASRAYSNAAASDAAVFRSSSNASSKALIAARVRSTSFSFLPAASLSVSRRSLKLRSRSIEVAAAFKPSKVKFSFLRYGTDASK